MSVPDFTAFRLSRRRASALALLLPCALAHAQDTVQDQQPKLFRYDGKELKEYNLDQGPIQKEG